MPLLTAKHDQSFSAAAKIFQLFLGQVASPLTRAAELDSAEQ
jgi:hypothetical protein